MGLHLRYYSPWTGDRGYKDIEVVGRTMSLASPVSGYLILHRGFHTAVEKGI